MQFQSLAYVFGFLPLVLIGYLLLRRTRFSNLFMLLASLYFYAIDAIWYLAPFFATALLDFYIGQKIQASEEEAYRKRMLIISVVANLGLLSVFKYTGWLSGEAAKLLGLIGVGLTPVAFTLPPAISFYTFQSMSYTIDIYRREFKPYRNVVDYLSFVAFFPHLVAGPIMRARDLLPQLARLRPLPDWQTVQIALFMILFGLYQKTVLADNCGGIVEFIQRMIGPTGNALPPGLGLLFAYAFAFQIYCDFAAYSTIARGTARLFGVDLMRNFRTPYFSANPSEFWTRWHISLSTWLRDYLYIPLGGNRFGTWLTLRNLMITMFLGGLWHGAGVLFIVWGVYHGVLLVLYRLLPIDEWLIRWFGRFGRFVATVIFFHLVCIGWIFFRVTPVEFVPVWESVLATPQVFSQASAPFQAVWEQYWAGNLRIGQVYRGMRDMFLAANWVFSVLGWGLVLFALPAVITDLLAWRRRDVEFADLFEHMRPITKVLLSVGLVYAIMFFARRDANEFIYFAF